MNQAEKIVRTLKSEGFTAYFAGGCVRDILLGKEPADYDIVTSACPEEVEKIFPKTVPIGKQFGIIAVVMDEKTYEVATFRTEGPYEDGRRPSYVKFTDEKNDALRRDLTINGMFYDPTKNKVIDYVEGQEDLKNKIIKFIGEPHKRILEDNLRLLRAVRFKISLDFQYETESLSAIKNSADLIVNVSSERIRDELNKIFTDKNRSTGLLDLESSNILASVLPEVQALKNLPQPREFHKEGDAFVHTSLALKSLPNTASAHLAWAVLLHDVGKATTYGENARRITFYGHAKESARIAKEILKRLKFPNYEIKTVVWLIENHMRIADISKMRPYKRNEFLLNPLFPDLIKLVKADTMGTLPQDIKYIEKLERQLTEAKAWKDQVQKIAKNILITGEDLIHLGFKPSSLFKKILEDAENQRLSGNFKTKEEAIKFIKEKYLK